MSVRAAASAPALGRVTRRRMLAAVVAGSAGVATSRYWGQGFGALPGFRTGPGAPAAGWSSPLGAEPARLAQLLRRASFGAGEADLERAAQEGYARTVDRLLETKAAEPPALPEASTPGGRFNPVVLQQWWVGHMLTSPTPFAERMTLFWHGHFTSDYRKVANNTFMYWQNLTWRRMSLDDLRSMLLQVTADPAMLRYLDLATSTAANPNENFARELLELFALGVGHYGEEDVRGAARALAGWGLPRASSSPAATGKPAGSRYAVYDAPAAGVFNLRRAFNGPVTFLGQTRHFDAESIVDRILAQPATAPFIVAKVLRHFAMPAPEPGLVRRLADRFRSSRYDVRGLMRDIFNSEDFSADRNYRSLVKSPTEFMVHAARALGSDRLARLVAVSGPGMGQGLFDPPDVGGWPNNDSWISSNNVVARVNFVSAALKEPGPLPQAINAARVHLDSVLSPQTEKQLAGAADDRSRWLTVLASPEFQLK